MESLAVPRANLHGGCNEIPPTTNEYKGIVSSLIHTESSDISSERPLGFNHDQNTSTNGPQPIHTNSFLNARDNYGSPPPPVTGMSIHSPPLAAKSSFKTLRAAASPPDVHQCPGTLCRTVLHSVNLKNGSHCHRSCFYRMCARHAKAQLQDHLE